VIEFKGVSKSFGDRLLIDDLSFKVPQGAIVGIIGPNGAGKSTMLAAIAGGVPLQSGTVRLAGQTISGMVPEQISRLGVSLVPEGRHVFGTLSVAENLRIGTFQRRDRANVNKDFERILEHFPQLRERLNQPGGRLSGGEQQMLVIARALLTRPRLVLVDEPSLGLAPRIIDQVYEILIDLRRRDGLTLLINEQSSDRVLKFADRIYVLRDGRVQLHDHAANLRGGQAIMSAYFGFQDRHNAPASERTSP